MTDQQVVLPRDLYKDLAEAGWSVVTTALGLGLGAALTDGVTVSKPLSLLVVASITVLVGDFVAAPLLRRLASVGGVFLALLLGLVGQLLVVLLAVRISPGVSIDDWEALLGLIIVSAAVMAVGRWLIGASDGSYVLGQAIRRGRSRARRADRRQASPATAVGDQVGGAAQRRAGLLVVMLDGVSPEVLRRAMFGGQAPTIARWLTSGSHQLERYWAQVPCTTPASTAGLLHGYQEIVAFRWWDRELGRLVVTNRPADAEIVEARMTPDQGLLREGGVAVSVMFSGGADTSLLVMSQAHRGRRGMGPGSSFVPFFVQPFLLPRAFLLTLGEMAKELFQGRRQRIRGVEPRVPRRGAYVALRGITNVLLRDLNLSLLAEHMMAGAPAIFVDLVDYDEIAHHAGPERPESVRALEGLDTLLRQLETVNASVSTDYHIVLVSDHGQSLGQTFEQLTGESLTTRFQHLMGTGGGSTVKADKGEEYGPLNALIATATGSSKGPSRLMVGPDRPGADQATTADNQPPELAVIASGNLGMAWFPRFNQRPDLSMIEETWPDLVSGLVLTQGVGLVMATLSDGTAVVIGREGLHRLGDSDGEGEEVEGTDPLAPYPKQAAADLRRLATLPNCGDLALVSTVDELGMVHAFEELVGSHGGLGGEQNWCIVVHPSDLPLDPELLQTHPDDPDGPRHFVGSWVVHEQLLRWRQSIGAGPG